MMVEDITKGLRVQLRETFDSYPLGVFVKGTTGTVATVESALDGTRQVITSEVIGVRLDCTREELRDWDNELNVERVEPNEDLFAKFWDVWELIPSDVLIRPILAKAGPTKRVAADLARAFADVLREWLTPEEFREMRIENRARRDSGDSNSCASHDYCDSNMAMDAAVRKVIPELGPILDSCSFADCEAFCELWNLAWQIADKRFLCARPKRVKE